MFKCVFCDREFTRKEGASLHSKHCKNNLNRCKRIGGFTVGTATGRASTPEKEALRISRVTEKAKLNNGGYRQGSGRGKKGWYKGFFCDSSYELAFVIYCLEHDKNITRNLSRRKYIWEGKERNYIPDFVVEDELIEIKGYKTKQWEAKLKFNPDVIVYYEKDLVHVFEYVKRKYGKDFTTLYEQNIRGAGTLGVKRL